MEFVAILGDRGSGKTNLLCHFLYDAYLQGRKVIANFHLEFPSLYYPFEEFSAHALDEDSEFEGAIYGADELGTGADSYEFFMDQPKKISSVVSQARKMSMLVVYTDQRFNKIAKRLRDQTDGFIEMRDIDKERHIATGHLPASQRHVCEGLFEARVFNDEMMYLRTFEFDGKPTRHLYNTKERIKPTKRKTTKATPIRVLRSVGEPVSIDS